MAAIMLSVETFDLITRTSGAVSTSTLSERRGASKGVITAVGLLRVSILLQPPSPLRVVTLFRLKLRRWLFNTLLLDSL